MQKTRESRTLSDAPASRVPAGIGFLRLSVYPSVDSDDMEAEKLCLEPPARGGVNAERVSADPLGLSWIGE
jgi:hypothetical protein